MGRISVFNVATKKNGDLTDILGSAYVPDYWVLETDYTNYSIVYACQDYLGGLLKLEFAWILSREIHLDAETVEYASGVYEGYGIDVTQLEDTLQDDSCVYDRP